MGGGVVRGYGGEEGGGGGGRVSGRGKPSWSDDGFQRLLRKIGNCTYNNSSYVVQIFTCVS